MKKKIISLFLVLMLVTTIFSACSGGNETATPSTDTGSSTETDSGTGDANAERALNLRTTASVTSLDWEQTTNFRDMKVWHQMFEGLYGMDESADGYYKELAEDVALSEDRLVYTITLRDGVKFHNGEDLKPSDVVFSYKKAMENPKFDYLTSMIQEVEEVDGKVVITIDKPYSPIDHTFFSIKISNESEVAAAGEQYGTVPHKAGTGPYYPTDYDIATSVKLSAFEDYWGGAPSIKKINYIVISDDSAAVIAFQNGELDYLEDVPLTDWPALSEKAGDHSALIKGNNVKLMGVNNLGNEALAKQEVREAILYAVSKDNINEFASEGYGTPANHYMPTDYVPTSPEDGFKTYEYDPEKAKELLAAAGYEGGVNVGTILTYGAPNSVNANIAKSVQADLAAVGITADISVMEAAVVTPKIYAQDYDICVFSDGGNFDFNNIRQQVHSESKGMYIISFKESPFDWERLEKLVDLGADTSVLDERLEHYTELWSIVMDTATLDPLIHTPIATVWADDLNIGEPVPTYYKVRTFSWA